ncbi:ABC transporter substrate-binding protein [Halomonas alkalicola]|uniref:ABC transporter substrate-binding protein n=1 Tax=Halomonas alkalicola TaxID=1930622 RepID=UPI0026604D22|nr:ABC transporter substrate-binding protein [Halomonas alkalicola]
MRPFWTLCCALLLLACSGAGFAVDLVRVELQLRPPHLDPTRTASATAAEAMHLNVFQGLTRIDREGQVRPALATRWVVDDHGHSLTLDLRQGVRFHDGRPFTAEVAAYSLDRLLDPEAGNPQRHLFEAIASSEVITPHRLRLRLARPDALLPFRLGLSAAVMVHPYSAATNAERPVGTGPYRVDGWRRDELHLSAYPGYWQASPAISRGIFTFTANRLEMENALAEGLIDLYPDGSTLLSHPQLSLRSDYVMQDGLSEGQVIVALNHARPPLDDLRVRRALSHAVNRQALLSIYPSAEPPVIGSHFSPLHPAYVELAERYPHSPKRARELLAEAQAEGLELTLTLPPTIYAERASLFIASDLEAVGIRVRLERLSWQEWLERVFTNRDYALTLVAHVEPFDLDIYARDDYYFNYRSETFRALWERIEAAQEESERHALLGEAQRHLAEEAVNVFLFMKPQQAIYKANLGGVWQNAPIPAVPLEELYWK